jgi:hypothetical protein
MNLHITKLYGCLSRQLQDQRAPMTIQEKGRRQFIASSLLQRLPETVTSKGLLVIEGYNESDWLNFDQSLYPAISQLGEHQIVFTSVPEELQQNPYFLDLVESNKLIAYKQSLAEILLELEDGGLYEFSIPESEERFAKYLTIDGKKIKIPKELYQNISRSAIVIDDHKFDYEGPTNDDEKYRQFKEFLATSNISNLWSGYPKGFAFPRDYYASLKTLVQNKIKNNKITSTPVILHGQSGGGKTVSLGLLTYELKKEGIFPVLFIEKNYQKVDEMHIDRFCLWTEEQGARGTIIIWDGMADPDLYYNLQEKLQARGEMS